MKKNIAVIFGGKNCEHEISIITALQLMECIDDNIYNIIPIYVDENNTMYYGKQLLDVNFYKQKNFKNFLTIVSFVSGTNFLYKKYFFKYKKFLLIDFCFVSMHGKNGEDGTIFSLLNLCSIPNSSANLFSSSCACDKCAFKIFLNGLGVDSINFQIYNANEIKSNKKFYQNLKNNLGKKIIAKPSNLGSSIGIEIIKNYSDYLNKISNLLKYDNKILFESYLEKIDEINIACFKVQNKMIFSNFEKPITKNEILSFDDKYVNNDGDGFEGIRRILNPEISQEVATKIKEICKVVYNALGLFGIVRFDFILKDNKVYLNEINTIPGSFANYLFDRKMYPFTKLINLMIEEGISRYKCDEKLMSILKISILSNEYFSIKK